jgi:iron(III) transport system ATP-binding protein
MSNSRIAQTGTPRELYEQPASLFVADFIGDANLLDAEVVEENGSATLVRFGTMQMELPRRGSGHGPIKLAVRPDALFVHTTQPDGTAIPARIARAAYIGRHVEYWASSAFGELFVIDRGQRDPLQPGSDVWISFSKRDVTIVRDDGARA